MKTFFAYLLVVSALLFSTQSAEARYLMEMGGYNLHPYAQSEWQTGTAVTHKSNRQGFGATLGEPLLMQQRGYWDQVPDDGYVDGYNLYQYAQSNPTNWRDPTGEWTVADCHRRWDICKSGADDAFKACKRDGYSHARCTIAYLTRMTACDAALAACLATSEESLKCCVAVGAGVGCAIAIIEPTPIGECIVVGVGVIVCPKPDPDPHP